MINDDGSVSGKVSPPGRTPIELLKSKLSEYNWMKNAEELTGMTDQELVDQLMAGLSLEEMEVELVVDELNARSKTPIAWQPLRWRLNGKVSAMLINHLEEFTYTHVIAVYIEYADDARIADIPQSGSDPHLIADYQERLKERENEILDEIFTGIYAHLLVRGMYDGVIAYVKSTDVPKIAQYDAVKFIDSPDNFQNSKLHGYIGPGRRFAQQFEAQYHRSVFENSFAKYDEVYYHFDKNGEIDWAIINYDSFSLSGNDVIVDFVLCDKHIYLPCEGDSPFIYGCGLYDVKKETFTDLHSVYLFDEYEGLEEAFRALDLSHLSPQSWLSDRIWGAASDELRGDADGDSLVTVLDATMIQKCRANLISRYSMMSENADADGDGRVTVIDATRIQKYKAGLCDLDGIPF